MVLGLCGILELVGEKMLSKTSWNSLMRYGLDTGYHAKSNIGTYAKSFRLPGLGYTTLSTRLSHMTRVI